LKGTVRERDEALSGTGREIKALRATVRDKDEALRRRRRRARSCVMRSWVGRPMLKVSLLSRFDFGLEVSGLC
jgi:hypothetical protein